MQHFGSSQTLLLNQKLGTDHNLWKCEFLSTPTKCLLLSPAACSALKLGVHTDCSQAGAAPQLYREGRKSPSDLDSRRQESPSHCPLLLTSYGKKRRESNATRGSRLAPQAGQKLCPEKTGQGGGAEKKLPGCSSAGVTARK